MIKNVPSNGQSTQYPSAPPPDYDTSESPPAYSVNIQYNQKVRIAKVLNSRATQILDNVRNRLSDKVSQQYLETMAEKLYGTSNINETTNCISSIVDELIVDLKKHNTSLDYWDIATNIINETKINPNQNESIKKLAETVMKRAKAKTTNSELKKAISEEIKKFLSCDSKIKDLSKIILEILGYSYINQNTSRNNGATDTRYDLSMQKLVLVPAELFTEDKKTTEYISSQIFLSHLKPTTRKILTIVMIFLGTITFLAGLGIAAATIVLPFVLLSSTILLLTVVLLYPCGAVVTIGVCGLGILGFVAASGLGRNILDTTLHDTTRIEIAKMLLLLLNNPEVKDTPRINYRLLDETIDNILSDTNDKLKKPYSDLRYNEEVFIRNMHDALHSKDDFDKSKQEEYKKQNMQQAENMINAMFLIIFDNITDQNTKDILLKAKDKYLSDSNIVNFYKHIFAPTIVGSLHKINVSNYKSSTRINEIDKANQEIFTEVMQKNLELYKTLHQGTAYATPVKSK